MIDKELIHQAAEDIDIFEADLTEEFEQLAKPPRRTIRLWPLAVAACIVGITFIFLKPPKPTQPEPLPNMAQTERRQYENRHTPLEAQLAHQQEIKEKGERLAAFVQEHITTDIPL